MEDKPWFEIYSGQTTDELISLKSRFRVDSLLSTFVQLIMQKEEMHGTDSISEAERVVLAIEPFVPFVNNGGFSQFYSNSSGKDVEFIVFALNEIGCPKTATLANLAKNIIGLPPSSSQEAYLVKISQDNTIDILLEPLNDKYWEYNEDIQWKLFAYIELNKEKIHIGANWRPN